MPKVGAEPVRRAAILNAALECFCEADIEHTSLEAIAVRAGCSKGVVAYYFKTKQDLIQEAFAAFLGFYRRKIAGDIAQGMTREKMLERVLLHALPPWLVRDRHDQRPINVSPLSDPSDLEIPHRKKALLFARFFSRVAGDARLQEILCSTYRRDVEGIAGILEGGAAERWETAYGVMALVVGLSFFRIAGFLPPGGDNRHLISSLMTSAQRASTPNRRRPATEKARVQPKKVPSPKSNRRRTR